MPVLFYVLSALYQRGSILSSVIRSSSRAAVRLTGRRSDSQAHSVPSAMPNSWARSACVQPRSVLSWRSAVPVHSRSVSVRSIIPSIYSIYLVRTSRNVQNNRQYPLNIGGSQKNLLTRIAFNAILSSEQKDGAEGRAAKQYPLRRATHPIKERVMLLNLPVPQRSVKHCPACGAAERIETGACSQCDLPLIQPTDLRKHLAAAEGRTELHQQLERAV